MSSSTTVSLVKHFDALVLKLDQSVAMSWIWPCPKLKNMHASSFVVVLEPALLSQANTDMCKAISQYNSSSPQGPKVKSKI